MPNVVKTFFIFYYSADIMYYVPNENTSFDNLCFTNIKPQTQVFNYVPADGSDC